MRRARLAPLFALKAFEVARSGHLFCRDRLFLGLGPGGRPARGFLTEAPSSVKKLSGGRSLERYKGSGPILYARLAKTEEKMSEFVYLYRRPPRSAESPQQMQDRLQRWRDWFSDLEKRRHIKSLGQPLAEAGGGVVRGTGRVSDGPYAETKDIIMGFTLVEARDLDQAIKLTETWPGFDEGGCIEVRPVLKL